MRILHVILSKGFTGAERSAIESCNHQSSSHETMCVVRLRQGRRRQGEFAAISEHAASRVDIARIPRRLFARSALRRVAARFRPDVIHAHLEDASRLVPQLETTAVTVATLHMHYFDGAYLPFDGLVCVAQWQERIIPAAYRGTVFHWPSLFIPHRRLSGAEITALRHDLGIADTEYLIGGVGSLVHRKGWDTLIRAFRGADLSNARVVILGDGRDRAELEALADSRVSLPGHRNNIKDFYQALDLFVCPSRHEAYPLVLLEALDAGVPVVTSDCDGCREIAGSYRGDVFPVDDAGALRELLIKHYQARTPRQAVDLSQHYPENSGRILLQAYETLLAQRRVS